MNKEQTLIGGMLALSAIGCAHEGIGQAGMMTPITVEQRAMDPSVTIGGGHRAKFPGGLELTSTIDYSHTEDVNGPVTLAKDYVIARMAIAKRFGQPGSVEHVVGGDIVSWNETGTLDVAGSSQNVDPVNLLGIGVTYEARFGGKASVGARIETLINSENVGSVLSAYVGIGF